MISDEGIVLVMAFTEKQNHLICIIYITRIFFVSLCSFSFIKKHNAKKCRSFFYYDIYCSRIIFVIDILFETVICAYIFQNHFTLLSYCITEQILQYMCCLFHLISYVPCLGNIDLILFIQFCGNWYKVLKLTCY